MSRIIGVTVGTTLSPKKIANKIKPVKTVNGQNPDENGNVELELAPLTTIYTGEVENEETIIYNGESEDINEKTKIYNGESEEIT